MQCHAELVPASVVCRKTQAPEHFDEAQCVAGSGVTDVRGT